MTDTIYLLLAIFFLLPGIVGVLFPVIPGIPYMFLVAVVYGLLSKFKTLTTRELISLGIIALISFIIDYSSGVLGARLGGASKHSITLGFILMLIGTFIFPILGTFIGLFVGVYLGEIIYKSDYPKALKAASSSLIGSAIGVIINFILALIFLASFIIYSIK